MEQVVGIAYKMYRCRRTAKTLHGDAYQQRVQWYKDTVQRYSEKEKVDTLQAVIALVEMCKDEAMAIIMFMAAAVEIIEGEKEPQA